MLIRAMAILGVAVVGAGAAAIAYAQLQGATQPQSAPRSWQPLVNDVSRGQLFEEYQRDLAQARSTAVLPFAFPSGFKFDHDAIYDVDGTLRKDRIFGIDISHYEGGKFPIADLAGQKISFLYIKATQGMNYGDSQFDHNWKTAGALQGAQKIPRGAYHFLSSDPGMSGKDQADSFIDYVNAHGRFQDGDLLPALDLEWDVTCQKCPDQWGTRHRTAKEIVDTTHAFLTEVKARTGRTPIIYTNKVFLASRQVAPADLLAGPGGKPYKVWIFDLDSQDRKVEIPDPANNLPHVLWQFSFTGKTGSYPGQFDVNVYNGRRTASRTTC
jgi:lysozyme